MFFLINGEGDCSIQRQSLTQVLRAEGRLSSDVTKETRGMTAVVRASPTKGHAGFRLPFSHTQAIPRCRRRRSTAQRFHVFNPTLR